MFCDFIQELERWNYICRSPYSIAGVKLSWIELSYVAHTVIKISMTHWFIHYPDLSLRNDWFTILVTYNDKKMEH